MLKKTTTTPKAVDLGLPSGTLWADRNLGAESVTDYGDYYMWGSTEPDTDNPCDWEHGPFNGGFSRYNSDMVEIIRKESFHNGILSDQYDAAHVQVGGNWHMPTMEQFHELIDYTDSEWTSFEGIRGRKLTSRYNDHSIFIPASGYRSFLSVYDVGLYAHLRSSTLYSRSPICAPHLYFYSGNCATNFRGLCIRPVC